MQESHHIALCCIRFAQERSKNAFASIFQRTFIARIDGLEEVVEDPAHHGSLVGLHGVGIDASDAILGLVHMLAVGMVFQIAVERIHRIGALCRRPVDRIDEMFGFGFVGRVGMRLQIGFERRFRVAHHGVGPVFIALHEQLQMSLNAVDVSLGRIGIFVEISLQDCRIVGRHGIFVGLLFFRTLCIAIKIGDDTNGHSDEHQANDDDVARAVLLLFGRVGRCCHRLRCGLRLRRCGLLLCGCYFSCYFHAAVGAKWGLVADRPSTFGAFDDCHILFMF